MHSHHGVETHGIAKQMGGSVEELGLLVQVRINVDITVQHRSIIVYMKLARNAAWMGRRQTAATPVEKMLNFLDI